MQMKVLMQDYSIINYNNSNNTVTEFKFKLIEVINNFAIKIANN